MADISKLKLPDGTTYNIRTYTDHVVPMMTKTFTGVIGTANDWANATFFFGTVMPTAFHDLWSITYRVTAIAAGTDNSKAISVLCLNGTADTYTSFSAFNSIKNTSYRPVYQHEYYRAKQAGITAGYGHALGLRLYSSWNPTTAENARTITVEIIETNNCTFAFFDSMLKYSAIPGTGTTNYNTYTEIDFASNGLQETADANTNYNLCVYFSGKTGSKGIWANSLFMEDGFGTYQNICTASDGTVTTSNRTVETTKIANANGFKVGGTIFYSTTSYNAATNISGWGAVATSYGNLFDARYTFNVTLTAGSLTAYKPIYLVGTIGGDGLFYLDSTWWTQTPNVQGKVYVLVGGCYDSTTSNCRIVLYEHNDWYYYDGTSLIPYEKTYASTFGDTFTGPVNFTDSVDIDELTTGNLVVTGSASFTNNIQANTINGVAVGATPKFTDTTYALSMSGNRITLTPSSGTASYVDLPVYDGTVTTS